GTATTLNRRSPIDEPPSKRITMSATVPIRSTAVGDSVREWKTSEAKAAATRKSAAAGMETRALSLLASSAAERAAATRSTSSPKLVRSRTIVRAYSARFDQKLL